MRKIHEYKNSSITLNRKIDGGEWEFVAMFHFSWEAKAAADVLNKEWRKRKNGRSVKK